MTKAKLNYVDIRFKKFLKTKYILVTFLLLFSFILMYGLIFTIGMKKFVNENNIGFIYFFEIFIYSTINVILIIYFIWKLYYDDNNDGVNKLEMRIGLTKPFMYFYRLLLILFYTLILLACQYLLNSIFYAFASGINKFFAFRIFISTFGWLAFISFFTIFISLLLSIIFNSRFIIVISAITTIIILFVSSISGNFISTKVVPSEINVSLNSKKNDSYVSWKEIVFTDENYIELGLNFTNYYDFYVTIKDDQKYKFLNFIKEIYNPNLTNEENLANIIKATNEKYETLNKLLIQISQENPNNKANSNIAQALIQTKDPILVRYGQILKQSNKFSKNSFSFLHDENDEFLKNNFYKYMFNSFLYCEEGQELDFISDYQVKLLNNFNAKMKKNVYFNPLYNLNLMFFGTGYNFYTDNLNNRTTPLFKQALNITFDIKLEYINNGKIIINSAIPKKTISTSYLVSINIAVFLTISCLLYFGYRIKK